MEVLPGCLTVMDAWCGAGEPLLIVKRAQQPDLVTVQRGDIKMASDSSLPNAAPVANLKPGQSCGSPEDDPARRSTPHLRAVI